MSKDHCNWVLTINDCGERETILQFRRKKYTKRKEGDTIYFVARRYIKESRVFKETVFIHYNRNRIVDFIRGQDTSTGSYIETTQPLQTLNLSPESMVPDIDGGYLEAKV